MTHWGGTGRYVEGERVFAPPAGTFDADWAAALARERLGAAAPPQEDLVAAAGTAWRALRAGADEGSLAPLLQREHRLTAEAASAVLRSVRDYVAAYGAAPA
ncbi:hypothetical protein [Vallicoccus soli]|uniref:Uncharacterized protein n=1 Tax=Vallicoccus soli TaxID=2339232 RepID=A0A3A3Z4T4_9ACTN|nr:hypothetical protein [Vallicoccus soli]RJK97983.1 hypothetical protein D5H78_03225 [Vallicoccus soli]